MAGLAQALWRDVSPLLLFPAEGVAHLPEMLMFRVRYFTDGVVIGGRGAVECEGFVGGRHPESPQLGAVGNIDMRGGHLEPHFME